MLKTNKNELNNFFEYYFAIIDMNIEENEKTNIKIMYENNKLNMYVNNNRGFSYNYLNCNEEEYKKISNRMIEIFSMNNTSSLYVGNNKFLISSDNINIDVTAIYNQEIPNCRIKNNFGKTRNNKNNMFEKLANLNKIYQIFLKTLQEDKKAKVYIYNNDKYLTIKISNDKTIFQNRIQCSKEQANNFMYIVCSDFISRNAINTYNINKLSDNTQINGLFSLTSKNVELIVPCNINGEKIDSLYSDIIDNSKKLTLKPIVSER